MDFVRVTPMTVAQETARKRLVYTLILACVPIGAIMLIKIKSFIHFLKSKPGILAILVGIGALVYAHIEPFFLRYTYKEIAVPKQFKPFTVVQLTDIHFQWPYPYVTKKKLASIVEKVNEINPDFIFLTGDFISRYRTYNISKYNTETIAFYLGQLRAKRGIYAIQGNNDRCAGDMLLKAFKENGVRMLMNEGIIDDDISITGILSSKNIDICNTWLNQTKIPDAPLKILLSHQPDTALVTYPFFDLQFSGHTHGGQCIAPFGIGPILHPKMGHKFIVGVYKIGNMILHVSTGIGISPLPKPLVRFNNIAEVSVIRVVPE
ncbi:transmembrane protein with metallophosphoesterase domain family [Trichomonas vaginalis G3]|uniref:transmembrane protein with metallophosphoesterase domain family n=1 Tax=Trichomonas vaginalis (strain ATCC PRA-98 / G3) TaxID=412133 RepID=UPI0021E52D3A|nr:transmembrane protein with metallophosphoesterase domain family [Trichomonas vaginalis G3]KAI5552659.1 transmembrane protein with metallophosphoesterase domain family [Trichomonas vaginalis G3]